MGIEEIERKAIRGGGVAIITSYRQSGTNSGQTGRGWLFLLTTTHNVDGGTRQETTGFDDIEAARRALDIVVNRPIAPRPLITGGTTHAELPGRRSIGEPNPAGPIQVRQVWDEEAEPDDD